MSLRKFTQLCCICILFLTVLFLIACVWLHETSMVQGSHVNNMSSRQVFPVEHKASPTSVPRLLFMMASYSFDQFAPLQKVLDCMRDICNAGWDVTVLIQVSPNALSEQHFEFNSLQERMFCLRANAKIPLLLDPYPLIGFGLNSKHRAYALAHLQEFDYFSYAEEDMLLTVSHLQAYLHGLQHLQHALPDSWMRYQIGFLRYGKANSWLACYIIFIFDCLLLYCIESL